MSKQSKTILIVVLFVVGLSLIGWNLRETDAKLREPPKVERAVTVDEVPEAVKATVTRELAGGRLTELEEKRRGDVVTWELDYVRGNEEVEVDIAEDGSVIERQSENIRK